AYGLGAVPIARILQDQGAAAIGTDNVAEAIELRKNGIFLPILVIDDLPHNASLAVEYDLTPSIVDEELLDALQRAAADRERRLPVWLVANVGFNRNGYRDARRFSRFVEQARKSPNLIVQGVYAHLSHANDDPDVSSAQVREYEELLQVARRILNSRIQSS